jgi:type VII secretion protein EccB
MERALGHGDIHADDDSPRAQSVSLLLGVLLAILTLAGAAVLTVWRPPAEVGDATVVMVRGTAALYVRVEDVFHPVLNFTSARLIAATAEAPRQVSEEALTRVRTGALLGIPGAPTTIGPPLPEPDSVWTVCDDGTTTVIAGPPAETAGTGAAVLAAGPSGTPYLLFDGHRARVDLTDPVVLRVLGLEGRTPAPVSRALLEMVPELPPITAPRIPGAGTPGPAALPGFLIGEVIRVQQASGTEFYVVLAGGIQQVNDVAADIIRHSGPSAAVTAVAPASLSQLPRLGTLAVQSFPEHNGAVGGGGAGAVCAMWRAGTTEILLGAPTPGARRVQLAQADGAGPLTDAVELPAGRTAYVRAEGTQGSVGALVTEHGVRFPVGDAESARILGLAAAPVAAPRAVLEALPLGPALTRSAALTAYDAVPAGSR